MSVLDWSAAIMKWLVLVPLLLVGPLVLVIGCSSGNKSKKCSFDGQTVLGSFPWPRFRADMANTGHTTVSLAGNGGGVRWSFQLTVPVSIGSSPIVGMDQVIFGSSDGQTHVLSTDGGTPDTDFTNN